MGIGLIEIKQSPSFFRRLFNKPLYSIRISTQLSDELDTIFDWCEINFGYKDEATPANTVCTYHRFGEHRMMAISSNTWAVLTLFSHDDVALFKLRWLEEVRKNML